MTGKELYLFFQQETPAGIRRAWTENPEDLAYRNVLSDYARDQGWDGLADMILFAVIGTLPKCVITFYPNPSYTGFYAGVSLYRFMRSDYYPRS